MKRYDKIKMKKLQEYFEDVVNEFIHSSEHEYPEQGELHDIHIPSGIKSAVASKLVEDKHLLKERLEIIQKLVKSKNSAIVETGICMVPSVYGSDPHISENILESASRNDNWEIREFASEAAGNILSIDFDSFSNVIEKWAESGDGRLMRSAALALRRYSYSMPSSNCDRIMDMLDRMMKNNDPYLRRNLGPYAIGDGILGNCKETAEIRIREWARSENQEIRKNTVLIFKARKSSRNQEFSREILNILAHDKDARIRSMAKTMLVKHFVSENGLRSGA